MVILPECGSGVSAHVMAPLEGRAVRVSSLPARVYGHAGPDVYPVGCAKSGQGPGSLSRAASGGVSGGVSTAAPPPLTSTPARRRRFWSGSASGRRARCARPRRRARWRGPPRRIFRGRPRRRGPPACRRLPVEFADAGRHLGKLVGDRQRRHHGEPGVADLAEFCAQPLDADIEIACEIHQVAFLAILAGHPELPPIDGNVHLRHRSASAHAVTPHDLSHRSSVINLRRQHAADGLYRAVDTLRDLAIGGLERARAGGGFVEFAGKTGAVGAEHVKLGGERFLAAVGFLPPLSCRIERVERLRQAPARGSIKSGSLMLRVTPLRCRSFWAKTLRRQLFTARTLRRIERERQRLSARRDHDLCMTGAGLGHSNQLKSLKCYLCAACPRDRGGLLGRLPGLARITDDLAPTTWP